jgi:hypothetical protein
VRLGIVLDLPENEAGTDIRLTAASFFHAQEPDIGIEASPTRP